jgi:hypothetical protein
MTSEANGRKSPRRLELVTSVHDELHSALAAGERALSTDGDLLASREHFELAYQLAERSGDPQSMAVAVLGLAGLWVSERRTVTGSGLLEARLQTVLPLLDERTVLALRVRARLAAEADYRRGTHEATFALLDEARATGNPIAAAEVLSLAHHCVLGPGDVALRRELAAELIKASFRTGRRSDQMMGLMWQTADAYAAGDPHAGRLLGELRDELARRDHQAVAFIVSAIDVMLAIRAGHLDDAETLAGLCAKTGATAGDIDSEWWPGGQLVTIRWYQGRLTELLPMLQERVHSRALSAVDNSTLAALAVAAALDGDRPTAASCLASLAGTNLAALPRSSSWLVTVNGIVEAAYLIQDTQTAARAYELLRPYADLPMLGGLGVTCFGSTQQALGVASLATGNAGSAIEHLQAAIQHNLALGHWPAVLSSRQRLALAYKLRGRVGDSAAAEAELDAARSEAGALGLVNPVNEIAAGDTAESVICERSGRKWRLQLGDASILVEDSIGMLHLAVLIANPRQDIAASDLVAGLATLGARDGGAGQPVLDPQAVSEYRSRLRELDERLEQFPASDDPEQASHLRDERDWLVGQLASATGLNGRARAFPDQGERARVAVGKAIRRAIARIAVADERIGGHLQHSVRTGARCSYWPG